MRIGRGFQGGLREEKKWFEKVTKKRTPDEEQGEVEGENEDVERGKSYFEEEVLILLRAHEDLIGCFKLLRTMEAELNDRVEELKLRKILSEYESGEFTAETTEKIKKIKRTHDRLDKLINRKKRRLEYRLGMKVGALQHVKESELMKLTKQRSRSNSLSVNPSTPSKKTIVDDDPSVDEGFLDFQGVREDEIIIHDPTTIEEKEQEHYPEDVILDVEEILAELKLVDREKHLLRPSFLQQQQQQPLQTSWMQKMAVEHKNLQNIMGEDEQGEDDFLIENDDEEDEGGGYLTTSSSSDDNISSDVVSDGNDDEREKEEDKEEEEEESFIELSASKSMTLKKKKDLGVLDDELTFDRLSFHVEKVKSRRNTDHLQSVKKKESEEESEEESDGKKKSTTSSSEENKDEETEAKEEEEESLFFDKEGRLMKLMNKKSIFMKIGYKYFEEMFSDSSEDEGDEDEDEESPSDDDDDDDDDPGVEIMITDIGTKMVKKKKKKKRRWRNFLRRNSQEELEMESSSSGSSSNDEGVEDTDNNEVASYTPGEEQKPQSYLMEVYNESDEDEVEDGFSKLENFSKSHGVRNYAEKFNENELRSMKIKPTHHSRGLFSYFIEKRNKSTCENIRDRVLWGIGCCGLSPAIIRVLKGILYIFYLQFSLRKTFIFIIIALLLKNLVQLIILFVFLSVELIFSSCVMVCCYYKDLQSLLRIILHWEYFRENRFTKLYHLLLLLFVFLVGLSGYLDFQKIFDPNFYDDNGLGSSSFWTGIFQVDSSFYWEADGVCGTRPCCHSCTNNLTASEIFVENNPQVSTQILLRMYLWLYALTPTVKYIVIAFAAWCGMVWRISNFDGPGCVLYENQLKERRQTSFFIPKYKRQFPLIRLTLPQLLNDSPSDILGKLVNVLYYVSSSSDVENFSKIRSLQHLEWGLLKNLDDQIIVDLRSFFLRRYTLRDEIPRKEGCIECRNWIHKNESCCCLRLCINIFCYCQPFGRDVSFIMDNMYTELKKEEEKKISKNDLLREKMETVRAIVKRGDARIQRMNEACAEMKQDRIKNEEMNRLKQQREERLKYETRLLHEARKELEKKKLQRIDRIKHLTIEIRAMQKSVQKSELISSEKEKMGQEVARLLKKDKEMDMKAQEERKRLLEVNEMLKQGKQKHEKNVQQLMKMYRDMYDSKNELENEMFKKIQELEGLKKQHEMFEKHSVQKMRKLAKLANRFKKEIGGLNRLVELHAQGGEENKKMKKDEEELEEKLSLLKNENMKLKEKFDEESSSGELSSSDDEEEED